VLCVASNDRIYCNPKACGIFRASGIAEIRVSGRGYDGRDDGDEGFPLIDQRLPGRRDAPLKTMATKLSGWLAEVAPGEWFILMLGELLLQRYSWLLDDAYVYFRYVDNLVLLGRGLVYNPGEFVEGFSSPAWCMLLALFRLTGCPYWLGIRILGALFFVVVWVLLVSFNRRLNPSLSKGDAINYPLIAIALTYGSSCYFTSGVEGPLVILSGVVFAFLVISPDSRGLQLAAGLGPLVRPELLVPWLFLVVYLRISRRRLPWTLISSAVCSMGGWVLFRVIYYADFFPNTFYLKSIHWYSQGFRYLWDTLLPYQLLPVILFFLLIGWMSRERMRLRLLMVLLALPVLFYVIRIGGDVRHFREPSVYQTPDSCKIPGLQDLFQDP